MRFDKRALLVADISRSGSRYKATSTFVHPMMLDSCLDLRSSARPNKLISVDFDKCNCLSIRVIIRPAELRGPVRH